MIIKKIRTYQCIKEKFISRHTSQNFSNLTVFRLSKRDNNIRQSVINPSAIFSVQSKHGRDQLLVTSLSPAVVCVSSYLIPYHTYQLWRNNCFFPRFVEMGISYSSRRTRAFREGVQPRGTVKRIACFDFGRE